MIVLIFKGMSNANRS